MKHYKRTLNPDRLVAVAEIAAAATVAGVSGEQLAVASGVNGGTVRATLAGRSVPQLGVCFAMQKGLAAILWHRIAEAEAALGMLPRELWDPKVRGRVADEDAAKLDRMMENNNA